jgi:hypothetical protein
MTADPRAALTAFVAALERHLEAAASRRGEDDPSVIAAYDDVADAFDAYDEVLMDVYGEVTPLEVFSDEGEDDQPDVQSDDESDDEFDDDDDEEDDGIYAGLSDSDIEDEPSGRRA